MRFLRLCPMVGLLMVIDCTLASGTTAMRLDNPVVEDARAAFAAIAVNGQPLGAHTNGVIPYPYYSFNPDHDFKDNHFQGMQRLRRPGWIAVSGSNINPSGDQTGPHGDLFFIHLPPHRPDGPLSPAIIPDTSLPVADARLMTNVTIAHAGPMDTPLWHPGGISALGDILVVPVENYTTRLGVECSQIWFFDVSDPAKPVRLAPVIDRTGEPVMDKAGAAAMIRLEDGRFLVILRTTKQLSFYLSHSNVLADGFEPQPVSVLDEREIRTAPGVSWSKFRGPSFQLIKQRDGKLFIVGFRRDRLPEARAGRFDSIGLHIASLFSLEFPGDDPRAEPVVTRLAERTFGTALLGPEGWGDFSAAPGLYVTDDGQLAIYAASRWLVKQVASLENSNPENKAPLGPDDADFLPMVEFWPVSRAH